MEVALDQLMSGFSKEDLSKANRIATGTEFYGSHNKELHTLDLEVCKAFRVYLHGSTVEERQEGYQEALQRLKIYREYCYSCGEGGKAHYADLEAKAYRYQDASKHSFGYAFYVLTSKNI